MASSLYEHRPLVRIRPGSVDGSGSSGVVIVGMLSGAMSRRLAMMTASGTGCPVFVHHQRRPCVMPNIALTHWKEGRRSKMTIRRRSPPPSPQLATAAGRTSVRNEAVGIRPPYAGIRGCMPGASLCPCPMASFSSLAKASFEVRSIAGVVTLWSKQDRARISSRFRCCARTV
jgi:hypothetical protein